MMWLPTFNESSEVLSWCSGLVVTPPDKVRLALWIVIGVLVFQILILFWKCRWYRGMIPPEARPPSAWSVLKESIKTDEGDDKHERCV